MVYLFLITVLLTFLYSYFTKQVSEDGSLKVIKKSSWQYKLIAWTVEREPRFKGYCPFFWSVWACIFLVPATLFIKFVKSCSVLFNPKGQNADSNDPNIDYTKWEPYGELLIHIHDGSDSKYPWYEENINEWKSRTHNWQIICKNAFDKKAKEDRDAAAKAKNKEIRDQFIENLADKTRFLFKPLTTAGIVTVGLGILYYAFQFLSLIVAATSLSDIIYAGVFVFSATAIIYGVKFLRGWLKRAALVVEKYSGDFGSNKSTDFSDRKNNAETFMYRFWQLAAAPFKLIARLYQKECPMVKMEE